MRDYTKDIFLRLICPVTGGVINERDDRLLAWSHDGYVHARDCAGEFDVLTPASTIAVLRAGYQPVYHASAGAIGDPTVLG